MITRSKIKQIEDLLRKREAAQECLKWVKQDGDCGIIEISVHGTY